MQRAIENARLFEAEQASKRELQESLEYQTATGDVLGVISRSPTNVQPVFDTIAKSAAQLCKAQFCHVFRYDGQLIHFTASHGQTPKGIGDMGRIYPISPGRVSASARAILTGVVEEIPDIHADPDYGHGSTANYRSIVAVPMLKDGRPVGAICMARSETGGFPAGQIELLRTFADQAVIAIENTRLFEEVQARTRELQESLQQQTATADVLKVISRSPLQLQSIFNTLVEAAARLCEADTCGITRQNTRFAISVADTGPGIPAHEQTRIFDQFHQVDASLTKAVGPVSGLPSPSRLSRCTVGAFGSSQRPATVQSFKWSFLRAPSFA